MNIVLTGMRATGKTTLGKLISEILNRPWIDLDHEIEKEAEMKTTEIIAQQGWERFRRLERQVAKRVSQEDNLVISTGGGAIIFEENAKNLKKNGIVILLTCNLPELQERISLNQDRPSLTQKKSAVDELEEVWSQRKETYFKHADIIYDTTEKESNDWHQKAQDVIALIQNHTS